MATQYVIPMDSNAQSALGGDTNAQEWYATEVSGQIQGHGDGNSVMIKFAKGGTFQSPSWGQSISLDSTATSFDASQLNAGMQAGFVRDGYPVVFVECDGGVGCYSNQFSVPSIW